MSQLESTLKSKEKQLQDGKHLFDQLKQDFKYNLKLLQERDDELEQTDVSISQMREQLNHQLDVNSQVSVQLHEQKQRYLKLEEDMNNREMNWKKQTQAERVDHDQRITKKVTEHSAQRLQWESQKRALEENLKVYIPIF